MLALSFRVRVAHTFKRRTTLHSRAGFVRMSVVTATHAPWTFQTRSLASREASPSTLSTGGVVSLNRRRNGAKASNNRRRADSLVMRSSVDDDATDAATGIPLRNLRRDLSANEYNELKAQLFKNTGLYATGLVAYSTLGYGLDNGISAALGGVSSLLYLKLLCEYVDTLSGEQTDDPDDLMYTRNLVYEPVTDVSGMLGGAFGKVGAVYSQALLQKRLLVPVMVAASCSAFNASDAPFDINYGPLFLGFLSYKAAVLQKLYQDLKPDIVKAIAGPAEGEE